MRIKLVVRSAVAALGAGLIAIACAASDQTHGVERTHTHVALSHANAKPSSTVAAAESTFGTGSMLAADAAQTRVLELGLNVSNLERSGELFTALDFTHVEWRTLHGAALDELWGLRDVQLRTARLSLGQEMVELREVVPAATPTTAPSHSNDRAFQHMAIIVSDMDRAYARLPWAHVQRVSDEPQTIPESNPAAGGIRAAYFKDHDGHNLELLWFPQNRGSARWHQATSALFLGIDHSAVGVTDLMASTRFYEGLGFSVAGRSLNFGLEQARLAGVPDARVQIVSLAPTSGPAVEFLHYVEPGPGSLAVDWAANSLGHWEITVQVSDLEATLRHLPAAVRKTRAIAVDALSLGYRWAALAYDPDGHCLRLVQR